jgi:hypothetical protein
LFQVANGNQQARLTVNSSGNVIIAGSLTVQGALSGNVTVPPGGQFIVQGTLDATGATAVRLPTGKVVGLTAADVGALPANVSIDTAHLASNAVTSEKIADGQITKAKLAADVPIGGGVPGSNSITTAMLQDGAVKKQKIDFTGMTANDVKAVPIEGKVDRWWTMTANFAGPISQFQNTADGTAGLGMRTIVGKTLPDELARAAIAGISTKSGVSGVWGEAPDDAYALYAAGQAFITKDLTVDGTITGKLNPGHIVDQFINGSECVLSKGDIVKLKGGTVRKFQDSKGDIPIAEVVPADTYNDSAIIGIVDSKVMSNDASYLDDIVPGERLYVVIMGTFAQCKVDATHSPIAAGDLLTSSVRPGYATKATTPQIGRIIGKALEPLEGREGRISVFVNIL